MSYQVPQHINKDKIFIVNRSEIEGRIDPHYNKPEYIELYSLLKSLKCNLSTLKEESYAIFSGITPKSGGDAYSSEPDAIPFVRSGDFSDTNTIDFSKLLYLKPDVHNGIMSASQLKKNDLLIAIVGATIGKIGIYLYGRDANINQAICGVRLKEHINSLFVQAFYQTSIGQKIIERTKRPVARANLNLEEVGQFPIPIVDRISQEKIIGIFQKGIENKKQKEIEAQQLLENIDSYLLEELGIILPESKTDLGNRFFIVSRSTLDKRWDPYYSQVYFRDAFKAVESGKYPVSNLKSISELITSGITPKSGGDAYTEDRNYGVPFIRSGNISIDGELNYDDLLYLKPKVHETVMSSSKLRMNDLLIAIVGATIGQVGIYLSNEEANINQAIALVRLKKGYNIQFVKELIKSSIGQLSLNRLKRPVARANINLEEIGTIKIVLPPIDKQNEIASHILEVRQKAKALQEEGKAILEEAKRKIETMIINVN